VGDAKRRGKLVPKKVKSHCGGDDEWEIFMDPGQPEDCEFSGRKIGRCGLVVDR
jgi:hypothetical protein